MKFSSAYNELKKGNKIKLPSWGGYWYLDKDKNTIMMHTKEGEELDVKSTDDMEYTIGNLMSEEWIIATEDNTPSLGGTASFGFDVAIRQIKKGLKVKRLEWSQDREYVSLLSMDFMSLLKLEEKLPIGTYFQFIVLKTSYSSMIPWMPDSSDMMADDWVIVN